MNLPLQKMSGKIVAALVLLLISPYSFTQQKPSTQKPTTIYLYGLSGSGKYTIAKKIAKYRYKIVDNHLINNPIFSLIEIDGRKPPPPATDEKIEQIRDIVFDFIKKDTSSNYIFTNELLESAEDRAIYNKVKALSDKRQSIFIPIKLTISSKERAKRIADPERKAHFKTMNPNEIFANKKILNMPHDNLLELDVSNLTPEAAAQKIIFYVARVKSSRQ